MADLPIDSGRRAVVDSTSQIAVLSYQVAEISKAVSAIDLKMDTITATVDRAQGVLAVVRWLGVGGVTIAVVALLKSFGGL